MNEQMSLEVGSKRGGKGTSRRSSQCKVQLESEWRAIEAFMLKQKAFRDDDR